jgi:type I restriction enzyme M protein
LDRRALDLRELAKRDKLNLDIFWLKADSLEDSTNLPDPDIIAAEIVEHLQAALAQFAEIASDSENAVHTAHSQLCSPKAH